MFNVIGIYLGIYIVGLFFTFLSEITYKKRKAKDVKNDFKSIFRRASIIYLVFVLASILYYFLGTKFTSS